MSEYFNPEVQQQYPDTCAIKSQQLVLEDFGIDVSETQLVQTANANGWYNGGGTNPQDVGNLLHLAGIPVTKLVEGEREKLLKLEDELHKRVIGQDEAVTAVANAVIRARAGLKDEGKPVASMLTLLNVEQP